MAKIFISHSTADGNLAIRLMDMLQTQFNLTRDNFFLTSDEELEVGQNWIEEIREGMENANIIMPLITPNFLESQFCLCELGAAWVNQKALVPVIVPPLDHDALKNTPYRSWVQAITLNTVKDLQRLGQAMIKKQVGNVNMVRFSSRAQDFFDETLLPFIKTVEEKETITAEAVKELKEEVLAYKSAYEEVDEELKQKKKENDALRKMKDATEVKSFDYAQMDEWETFIDAVKKAEEHLNKLPNYVSSVLYHDKKSGRYGGGFIGEQDDLAKLGALENEGFIKWDQGWEPDYEHGAIIRANTALNHLATIIRDVEDSVEFLERFDEEYKDVRFSLMYSTFWEEVLGQHIQHSSR